MKTLIATLMIIISIALIAYGARPRVSTADSEDVSTADYGHWHVKCCDCPCEVQ